MLKDLETKVGGGAGILAVACVSLLLHGCPARARAPRPQQPAATFRLGLGATGVMKTVAVAFAPEGSALAVVGWEGPGVWRFPTALTVWDFRTGKILANEPVQDDYNVSDSFRQAAAGYVPGGAELAVCGVGDEIHIFKAPGYHQVARILLGYRLDPAGYGEQMNACAISADGTMAALALFEPPAKETPGAGTTDWPLSIQEFDLRTRKRVGEWTFPPVENVWYLAVSPSGARVAWSASSRDPRYANSVLEGKPLSALNILAVNDGRTVSVPTSDPVDQLSFVSDARLLTALDGISVWDAATGKLLRKISSRPNEVHFVVQSSGDGRIVLGYTGTEDRHGEDSYVETVAFRLWDGEGRRVLFTSPQVSAQMPCWKSGNCGLVPPQYTLSHDGHLVASWGDAYDTLVYEIPSASQHPEP